MSNEQSEASRTSEALAVPAVLAVGCATLVLMAALMAVAARSGLTVNEALADPQEFTRLRFLGVVSTAGVLGWAATATICGFAVFVLHGASDPRARAWLLAAAAIAVMLLVDDLFLVHEFADDVVANFVDFDRTRTQKDILEATVFAGYATVFVGSLLVFRSVVMTLDIRLLALSIACLGCSAFLDLSIDERVGFELIDDDRDLHTIIEEGLKLLGIAYFLVFHARSARTIIRRG